MGRRSQRKHRRICKADDYTDYKRSDIYKKIVFLDNLQNGDYIYGEIIKNVKITNIVDFINFLSSLKSNEKFAPNKIIVDKQLFRIKNYEDFMSYILKYSPRTINNTLVFTNFTELHVYKVKIINEHE